MKCRLCLQEKELVNSHILPNFFYKHIWKNDKRLVLKNNPKIRTVKYQGGVKEFLLCKDCDGIKISQLESYAKQIIIENENYEERFDRFLFTDVDYHKFYLFQISLLWRMSVSSDVMFDDVRIGKYEENLRLSLLNENSSKINEFGCVIAKPINYPSDMNKAILKPVFTSKDGINIYVLYMNGLVWMFFVSEHLFLAPIQEFFLQRNSVLPIVKDTRNSTLNFVFNYLREFANSQH